jgi:hypothetical protein
VAAGDATSTVIDATALEGAADSAHDAAAVVGLDASATLPAACLRLRGGGGPAPVVATCSLGTKAMTDGRADASGGGWPWAADLPFGWWIVDSGADWCVAGAFIYEHSRVTQRLPNIWVRGVEGASTQVDAIVRVVVGLKGADWLVQEVLVCDSFTVALWSTEYMSHFGFSAYFGAVGEEH